MSAGASTGSSSAAAIRSQALKNLILEWRDGKPVHLGDIADVHIGRSKATGFAYQNGNPALGLQVFRADGANVLATVNAVKAELEKINDGPAKEQGVKLAIFLRSRRTSSIRRWGWSRPI